MYYITQNKTGLITGRYTSDIHRDNIPADAVEVTEEIFNASIQMYRPALVNGKLVELPPEPLTAEQLTQQAISNAKALLNSTDWIMAKYTDLVVMQKLMTEEEFNTKYTDILVQRNNARVALNHIDK
jgi:hypothetical protein